MTNLVVLPAGEEICALVADVWTSFLGDDERPQLSADTASEANDLNQVISAISISGEWAGDLLIGLSMSGAVYIAAAMFGVEADEVSVDEIADAVGELANVVAGNIKSMLPEPSILSLPQVAFEAQSFALPLTHLGFTASLIWGEHAMRVSLWEAHANGNEEQ